MSQTYVAINGEDRPGCGRSHDTPCASLTQAINSSSDDVTVLIDATGSDNHPYWYCKDSPLKITHSVRFVGYGGKSKIGCDRRTSRRFLFNISGSFDHEAISVSFRNVYMSASIFYIFNTNLTFENSIVDEATWQSNTDAFNNPYIGFFFIKSEWLGSVDKNCTVPHCTATSELLISGKTMDVLLQQSNFYHTRMMVKAGSVNFLLTDSIFTSNPTASSVALGGIYLTVEDGSLASEVVVRNTLFEHQVHSVPIQSIMNLYEAGFLVRAMHPIPNNPTSNITAYVENSQFIDNERGLTFIGPFRYTNVTGCTFKDNVAMHAGAGILYLTSPSTPSFATNSVFESNTAGGFRAELIIDYEHSFKASRDEVRIQSICCKGVISFVGKGGAIRIQRGNLNLVDCVFRNNTARLLGGSVFVDRDSSLFVENSVFQNSPMYNHALQGDLFYSNGKVQIRSAQLIVLTAKNHVAIIRHSGDHWSIEVLDVSVTCPIGYRLRVTNTSAYGVTTIGLRQSYKMDQLSYFCESCARNKYSLDFGYMNYSLVYTNFAYYTLLVNGERPKAAYNGTYVYHDITCLHCPYGGKCQQGISAVPNFWGYIQGDQVKFQHCAKGYCCSSTDCRSFNTCAKSRTGRLCGRCKSGYSEALFSAKCVEDDNCDPTWLWPVALGSGCLYFLFLLFQKDLRDLMFFQTVKFKDIPFPCVKRRYEMNHIIHEDHIMGSPLREEAEMDNLRSDMESELEDTKANNNEKTDQNETPNDKEPAPDTGASFLIILFYYFQDAQLLHITTVFTSADNRSKLMLKEILSGLFKFRVELFQFMDAMCFLYGVTPTIKLLIKALLVPYVLFQFAVMYLLYRWWHMSEGKNRSNNNTRGDTEKETEEAHDVPKKTFLSRLATGFVLSLLFTYQMLATTSFTLLNCVPVGDENVLFIDGTIACYEVWQYGVMAYTTSCIVPFCLVLLIGPGLLKDGIISLPQFFFACLIPLPFLVYWVIIRLSLRGERPQQLPKLSAEAQAVIQILQGPFKESETRLFGPTCGAGVLIGRRLVLVLLFTFVNDTLIRMLCMMLVCFIILLHHVHVLPYKDTRGNIAGSASAAALLIVGGINLVRAGFEASEYIPQGPNAALMQVFEELENVLMLWFPAAVMGLVFISMTFKLLLLFLKFLFTPTTEAVLPSPTRRVENEYM